MNILHVVHHWLVPHETNNHRSKALHIDSLFAYTLLFLVFNFGIRFLHIQVPDVLGYATDIRIEQLLSATNEKRQSEGLSPVQLNITLSEAAAAKAADMFTNGYWAHNSPAGKTPWDFINTAGYKYTLAGENLAKNFQTSDGVVEAWMASPTHRANVLKSGYQDVGFAVVNGVLSGEETTLVVQMFGATKFVPVLAIQKVKAEAPQPAKTVVLNEPIAQSQVVEVKPATSVLTNPYINIASLSHRVVYMFVGMLLGILALDAYIVSKRKVVRLVGHNIAHMLFLISIIIGGLFLTRGALL